MLFCSNTKHRKTSSYTHREPRRTQAVFVIVIAAFLVMAALIGIVLFDHTVVADAATQSVFLKPPSAAPDNDPLNLNVVSSESVGDEDYVSYSYVAGSHIIQGPLTFGSGTGQPGFASLGNTMSIAGMGNSNSYLTPHDLDIGTPVVYGYGTDTSADSGAMLVAGVVGAAQGSGSSGIKGGTSDAPNGTAALFKAPIKVTGALTVDGSGTAMTATYFKVSSNDAVTPSCSLAQGLKVAGNLEVPLDVSAGDLTNGIFGASLTPSGVVDTGIRVINTVSGSCSPYYCTGVAVTSEAPVTAPVVYGEVSAPLKQFMAMNGIEAIVTSASDGAAAIGKASGANRSAGIYVPGSGMYDLMTDGTIYITGDNKLYIGETEGALNYLDKDRLDVLLSHCRDAGYCS
jgi:hypothetical protein